MYTTSEIWISRLHFIPISNPYGQTLKLLNASNAPTQILYVVGNVNYTDEIQKVDILDKPLNQTHIIYLNHVADNGKLNKTRKFVMRLT